MLHFFVCCCCCVVIYEYIVAHSYFIESFIIVLNLCTVTKQRKKNRIRRAVTRPTGLHPPKKNICHFSINNNIIRNGLSLSLQMINSVGNNSKTTEQCKFQCEREKERVVSFFSSGCAMRIAAAGEWQQTGKCA